VKQEPKYDVLLTPPGVASGVLSLNLANLNTQTVTNEKSLKSHDSPHNDTSGIVSDMLKTMFKQEDTASLEEAPMNMKVKKREEIPNTARRVHFGIEDLDDQNP